MKRTLYYIFFLVALFPVHSIAMQTVDGVQIEYPSSFLLDIEKSEKFFSSLPQGSKPFIKSIYIYDAPGRDGVGEATIIVSKYHPEAALSVDGAVEGVVAKIKAMDGVKNIKYNAVPKIIPGFDVRLLSIQADRWSGEIGIEALIAYEKSTNTAKQIQLIFASSSPVKIFSSLADQQKHSRKILESVRFVNQKNSN